MPEPLARATVCPAALNLHGEHFSCDWPINDNGHHRGWAHANRQAQAVWTGVPDELDASAEPLGRC